MNHPQDKQSVAVIGGTGQLGLGLARRLASAGYRVTLGSRDAARAKDVADQLGAELNTGIWAASYADAVQEADIVLLAVPFASQRAILEQIQPVMADKLLIDATVPLVPPKVSRVQLPPEGAAALVARDVLGEDARIVAAFHNVGADKMNAPNAVACEVLVFGNRKDDRERVVALADRIGMRAWHAGPLANSAAAEALTSVLIFMNKFYGMSGAGIRISA